MLRNDDNGRQIRCLMVEDYQTGGMTKVRDQNQFQSILATTDEMLVTKVYEPDMAERDHLMRLIKNSVGEDLQANLSETDVLYEMLKLTDLEIDSSDLEANKALLEQILQRPNALFLAIKAELEIILIEVVASFHDVASAYRAMPEEWLTLADDLAALELENERMKKEVKTLEDEPEEMVM